jgi:hypothetical protein
MNTSQKKSYNLSQLTKIALTLLNFVSCVSTVFLTGTQVAYGVKLRYFSPMPFERDLMLANADSIKKYHMILN